MWKKLLNMTPKKDTKDSDVEIINVLDQLKSELNSNNLNLKKQLQEFTNYFNNIPISYAIMSYDGMLIRVNNSLSSLFSCKKKNCIGTNIVDYIHPDDIEILKDFIRKLKKLSNDDKGDNKDEIIVRVLTKSGDLFYMKWGAVHLENDQLIMLFGQDITHEIDLGDKLQKFILSKNNILNSYPGAIISTDLKGNITEFNSEAEIQTGYKSYEVMNKSHLFDIFPDKNLFKSEYINKIHKSNLRKKDGKLEISYILLLPLLNENKISVGYLGIWHNEEYLNYIKSIN